MQSDKDFLDLDVEHALFPKDEPHVPNESDPVGDFLWAENYGAAKVDDSALVESYRKRAADIRTATRGTAPGNDPPADPLQAEKEFQKAFAEVAKEIRSMIRNGNWDTFVRNTAHANPAMVKEAREELISALRDDQ